MYGSLHGIMGSMQNSDTISVKFSVFKNFPSSTIFIIKSPNFQHLQTLTCSLHFWHLQSANVGFLIASGSVRKIYWNVFENFINLQSHLKISRGFLKFSEHIQSSKIFKNFWRFTKIVRRSFWEFSDIFRFFRRIPKIPQRLPTISKDFFKKFQKCWKVVSSTLWQFLKISEDVRRLPIISENFKNKF